MKYTKKIRTLKYSDFKRIKQILAKYVEQTGDETVKGIISAARASTNDKSPRSENESSTKIVSVFFDVFKKLLSHLDQEINGWFCDLINVTPKEYEELPFDIDMQIINQLKEAPEVENFFTGASHLSSIAGWFGGQYQKLKEKYDFLTESEK